MAFPIVEDTVITAVAVAEGSHDVLMPAVVNAGDLLIMHCTTANSGAIIGTPTGWTLFGLVEAMTTSGKAVFAKDAIGDEDGTTVNVTRDNAGVCVFIVQRISGWAGTLGTDVEIGTSATSSSTAPDPPNLTASWGPGDNLFIADCAASNDDESITAYPVGYENTFQSVSGGGIDAGCSGGVATKTSTLAIDDPGTFTLSGSEIWITQTLVVKEAPAASAPVLTLPTVDFIDGRSLDGTVTTDVLSDGTIYWYVSIEIIPPSVSELKTGIDAIIFGSQSVTASALQTIVLMDGVNPATNYYVHYIHTSSIGDSNIATTAVVTTPSQSVTVSTIVDGENLTNLYFRIWDSQNVETMDRLHVGSGEVTDGSGNLEIDLNSVVVTNTQSLLIYICDFSTGTTITSKGAMCFANAVVA